MKMRAWEVCATRYEKRKKE